MNKFKDKNYYTLNHHLKEKYGKKVFKISLNAGLGCPNVDGSKAVGGCTFCTSSLSGDFAGDKKEPLLKQFNTIKDMLHLKWPEGYYIPYFQAGTNTYASLETLKELYEPVLHFDDNIVGLAISTRPDALEDDVIDYLGELNTRCNLWVELGLQTINDETSASINRAHTLAEFEESFLKLRAKGIDVIVHIINGLPGETKEDMINTVKYLSKLDLQGIKIHLLHIMKNTQMGTEYLKSPFKTLSLEEYVDIVCDQLELLPDNVVIHRLTGDAPKDLLIEPFWSLKKFVVMNEIDKEMRRRNSFQGSKFNK